MKARDVEKQLLRIYKTDIEQDNIRNILEGMVQGIAKIIYEGYRIAFYDGEYPDGIEVSSRDIAEKIIEYLTKEKNTMADLLKSPYIDKITKEMMLWRIR
jgi:hypothetical protein